MYFSPLPLLLPALLLLLSPRPSCPSRRSGRPRGPSSPLPPASLKVSPGTSPAAPRSVAASLDLQCPPCDRIHCSPRRARNLKCRGGVTRGICNCCPVCAKTEGEPCGGTYSYLGRCDRGLACHPQPSTPQIRANKLPQGTCKAVPRELLDQGVLPLYCQPKCTPKFCQANRKAICAAVDNADVKQPCQGDCQHTSCSACRYVRDEPDCVKCGQDDFSCMRRFAKCVKNTYCTRQKYPCKRQGAIDEGAKFRCLVPDCLVT